jgi:hypothetical protein
MVGVRVGLEHVVDAELLLSKKRRDLLDGRGLRARGQRVVVEHRVDDHGVSRLGIEGDEGEGERRGVEKVLDVHDVLLRALGSVPTCGVAAGFDDESSER